MKRHLTTAAVARAAEIGERRVRQYADSGLIECVRDSAGRRLFPPAAIEQARQAYARRTRHIRRQ